MAWSVCSSRQPRQRVGCTGPNPTRRRACMSIRTRATRGRLHDADAGGAEAFNAPGCTHAPHHATRAHAAADDDRESVGLAVPGSPPPRPYPRGAWRMIRVSLSLVLVARVPSASSPVLSRIPAALTSSCPCPLGAVCLHRSRSDGGRLFVSHCPSGVCCGGADAARPSHTGVCEHNCETDHPSQHGHDRFRYIRNNGVEQCALSTP
mgnify:CR=1 FL=1